MDESKFKKDFNFFGSSNYAFNLVLKNEDQNLMHRLKEVLFNNNIEFRRGSAGGGNQVRQPYLKNLNLKINPKDLPHTEHVNFYGMYIGNLPTLSANEIKEICSVVNSV